MPSSCILSKAKDAIIFKSVGKIRWVTQVRKGQGWIPFRTSKQVLFRAA